MKLLIVNVLLVVLVVFVSGCPGDDGGRHAAAIPSWAKVAPEQIAEARKYGVPVAFENDLGMRFVLIPAGTFLRGSPEDEEGRYGHETQHEVTVTEPFYMSNIEVTNGQYRRWKKGHDSGYHKGNTLNGDQHPVVRVSHAESTAFAAWVSAQDTARGCRLPTEAEWEHACRAGTTGRFSYGQRDEDLLRYGNFSDRTDPSGPTREDLDDGYAVTAPVGSYLPNGWGLYDMHGNVWEWCRDRFDARASGAAQDPTGPERDTLMRVLRGGSWANYTRHSRSASRRPGVFSKGLYHQGFRLVSPLPEEAE